ncbi:hypothetical protein GGD63_006944 [Bradyrhizobium sp. cir1]|uniref:patatin-like phospholipase family protein n=1 Tax=Bradyrhizobium sp. cir1 TaxID=1445730 RepID=UPI0016068750|nr:patatin-like phospholipase family protein [Bradyrhizobium sp. cir1]MBB4374115.1 hypothetical protein [Bradyrhizobium sp. cir1]
MDAATWKAVDGTRPEKRLEGPKARQPSEYPIDLLTVLLEEHEDVLARRKLADPDKTRVESEASPDDCKLEINTDGNPLGPYLEKAHRCPNLNALCLSGGGIRSAAFALGVIQGFAKFGLLDKFDRLSTVSGGGYIGSWLTAWVQRSGYPRVLSDIHPSRMPDPHSPVAHLWRYSRYLAPRAGLLSTDFLTLITLYVRNLLLNWLVLIPFVAIGIVAIKAIAVISWSTSPSSSGMLVSLAVMFAGWALLDSLLQRPGWEVRSAGAIPFGVAELLPMLLGAICATMAMLSNKSDIDDNGSRVILDFAMCGAALAATAWLFAYYFANFARNRSKSVEFNVVDASSERTITHHVVIAGLAFAVSGAFVGVLFALITVHTADLRDDLAVSAIITLGPSVVILALFAGELLYVGLTSYAPWGDAEREWLARSGGRHGLAAALWGVAVGTVLFGPLIISYFQEAGAVSLAAAGGVAGMLIALLGKAPRTAAIVRDTAKKTFSDYSIGAILALAVPIFSVCLLALISWSLDKLTIQSSLTQSALLKLELSPWRPYSVVIVSCLFVGLLFSCFVNINRFSLHNVYRNRLIRAFLGASNFQREPSPETDFDDRDNLSMHELWPSASITSPGAPPQLLYVNMSLNVLRGNELAWQERRALPFVATPRYVGCGSLLWIDCEPSQRYGCYRSARLYACGEKKPGLRKGLTLGTVMTLSGAAASPNMGYHSSAALSLLLTLFNVRLGAWFANPGPAGSKKIHCTGPAIAVGPLFQEALGLTDEDRAFVYLSDGGHFENLGAYEMIRRRCRFIVISDAGCDGDYTFEDLGSLVRKVRIDFGVDIQFFGLERLKGRSESSSNDAPVAAIADVIYPELPGWPGKLLYIKPGYRGGSEPASVRSYGQMHPEFPHESTANQFFGESQFEAYRALGEYSVQNLAPAGSFNEGDIASFMAAVEENLRR